MDFILISFLVILAICLILFILMMEVPSIRSLYLSRNIHGPKGIPVFGSLFLINSLTGPGLIDFLRYLKDTYPRLTCFHILGSTFILSYEAEDIQCILGSINHIKKGLEYNLIIPWMQYGLLTSYGEKWHFRRKLLTPTFHFSILQNALYTINGKTKLLVEKLKNTNEEPVNIEGFLHKCALDIIGESAMGLDLKAQSDEENAYLKCVKEIVNSIIQRYINVYHYKPWIYILHSSGRQFYRYVNTLHSFSKKVISERKEIHQKTALSTGADEVGKKRRKAFLDCLLDAQRLQPDLITDEGIREEVDTFMFEGHDTISSTLMFTVWLLGTHQDVQEKVYEELQEIFGDDDREANMADLTRMVYLEMCIKESLRLYPSVPYMSRKLTQDCVLGDGTIIPNHANVIVSPYLVHRNVRYFPDPEKFDPERFSEDNSVERHPFAYIPFSAGPRNCIGQKFAMIELKVTLASIIRNFKLKSITKSDDFILLPYVVLKPDIPLVVHFFSRKNPTENFEKSF